MQSSPNRSESASTTTRPWPCRAATISGRFGADAVAWVRARTAAPFEEEIVVARYRQAALTRASTSPARPRSPSARSARIQLGASRQCS